MQRTNVLRFEKNYCSHIAFGSTPGCNLGQICFLPNFPKLLKIFRDLGIMFFVSPEPVFSATCIYIFMQYFSFSRRWIGSKNRPKLQTFSPTTTIFIIFWKFLMVEQIFLSPQVKQFVIISNKYGIYE